MIVVQERVARRLLLLFLFTSLSSFDISNNARLGLNQLLPLYLVSLLLFRARRRASFPPPISWMKTTLFFSTRLDRKVDMGEISLFNMHHQLRYTTSTPVHPRTGAHGVIDRARTSRTDLTFSLSFPRNCRRRRVSLCLLGDSFTSRRLDLTVSISSSPPPFRTNDNGAPAARHGPNPRSM